MSHYQQSFSVRASQADIYTAISTIDGLRGWWTQDCTGDVDKGSRIQFHFGGSHKEMRVELLIPSSEVRWLCTAAHINHDSLGRKDEWVGTQIVFRLTSEGEGRTRVDFEHIGLVPSFECYELCNNGWQFFLNSLQQFAETGVGTPYESGDNCEHKLEAGSL